MSLVKSDDRSSVSEACQDLDRRWVILLGGFLLSLMGG